MERTTNKGIGEFLGRYWSILLWVVTGVFAAGGLYSQFSALETQVYNIEERLGKKVVIINQLEARIQELEKKEAYLEGYTNGRESK